MRIFMITRGSQGDVLPYLAVAKELTKRGHEVAINLPTVFEERVKDTGWKYFLQKEDDMKNLMGDKLSDTDAIKWVGRVMGHQCNWLPNVLKDYDILMATNTELAAPTLAEHCNIPFVRTSYAPILPSKIIPPPLFPYPKPSPILTPNFLWYVCRVMGYVGLKKIINENRTKLGLAPLNSIDDFRRYTSEYGNNALTYSGVLADADPAWDAFSWKSMGYCFNDDEAYDEKNYSELMDFIRQDSRPVVFFTIGSCDYPNVKAFYEKLLQANRKLNYRLVVGAGWSKNVNDFTSEKDVYVLKGFIPHCKILPEFSAMLHHAGCGTTHSAARFALPQLHLPLIIDQHYWSYQCVKRGIAPDWLQEKKISTDVLTRKIQDVVENPVYKQNAIRVAQEMEKENGVKNTCDYLESFLNK